MKELFKKIIYILFNLNKIYDSLVLYNDKLTHKAIKFYKERIDNMSELFKQDPFNYEKKFNTIASINASLNNLKTARTDYELVKMGINLIDVLDIYKKENLMIIMNLLSYSNPIYNMEITPIEQNEVKILFDASIAPNKFVEILDSIYTSASEYEIHNTVEKSYSTNRICYHMILKSKDIYVSLIDIVTKINDKLFRSIEEEINIVDLEYINGLHNVINLFNEIFPDISKLEKVNFGKKEEIMKILDDNKQFTINLIKLLDNKIGGDVKCEESNLV